MDFLSAVIPSVGSTNSGALMWSTEIVLPSFVLRKYMFPSPPGMMSMPLVTVMPPLKTKPLKVWVQAVLPVSALTAVSVTLLGQGRVLKVLAYCPFGSILNTFGELLNQAP